jgi:prephenate dehydrogenase (NADP+)
MRSGHFVSRCSDYIIYSVEAKNIDAVVKAFGPCMLLYVISLHLTSPRLTLAARPF